MIAVGIFQLAFSFWCSQTNAITFRNQQLSINGLSWVFPMKRLIFLWPHHVKVSFQRIFGSAFTDRICGSIWWRAENTIQLVQLLMAENWQSAVGLRYPIIYDGVFKGSMKFGIPRWRYFHIAIMGCRISFCQTSSVLLLKHWTDWMRGKWFFHLG